MLPALRQLTSIAGNVMTITVYIQTATSIVTTSGSGQSGAVATAFASPLVATVLDQHGFPMAGVSVTETAPAAGPTATGTFSNSTNTITGLTNGLGQLPEVFTANTVPGTYTVSASAVGVATPTTFSLTNIARGARQHHRRLGLAPERRREYGLRPAGCHGQGYVWQPRARERR